MAVVGDANRLDAALGEIQLDATRPRVDGVLDQLFDDGNRTFDDLAGSDFVSDRFGENTDGMG